MSLLAGLDLPTGRVTETVSDTHNRGDFIGFLDRLDAGYPPPTKIRLLLDNHSSPISKQTQTYLEWHPQRFELVFPPQPGSWLNLVATRFSQMTRSMLREMRVATKQELIDRIHLYFAEINSDPVIFRWRYKMDEITIGSPIHRTHV